MIFNDAAGQRQAKSGAVALRCEERAEDVRQIFSGYAAAVIHDFDDCKSFAALYRDRNLPVAVDRLDRVQQKVQQHLMDLIAVVLNFGEGRIFVQGDLDSFREPLLAAQYYRVFYGGIEITLANLRRMRACRLQQIGHDVIDAADFLSNVFDHSARRTGRGQVASDDLDDSSDSSQGSPRAEKSGIMVSAPASSSLALNPLLATPIHRIPADLAA